MTSSSSSSSKVGLFLFQRRPDLGFYEAMRAGRPEEAPNAHGVRGPLHGVERRKLCAWLERGGKAMGPPVYCSLSSPNPRMMRRHGRGRGGVGVGQGSALPTCHAEMAALASQGASLRSRRQWGRTTLVVIRYVDDADDPISRMKQKGLEVTSAPSSLLRCERPCADCLRAAQALGVADVVFVAEDCELRRKKISEMTALPSIGAAWVEQLKTGPHAS